jgi:translation initiation factor IF-1
MAKAELIEFQGTILERLPEGRFRIALDNGHESLAYTAGKLLKHRIRLLVGDHVTVEMTPYDLTKCRIIYRHKDEKAVLPAPQPRRNFRRH